MKELVIGAEDAGSRLDKYLNRYLPKAPSGFVYKMLRKKNITRNGKKAEGSERLSEGDVIRLFLAEETISSFASRAVEKRTEVPLSVVFENDLFLAVNKPAGMLTQGDKSGTASLAEALTGYLLRNGSATEESLRHFRPSPANRLDRNTSGLVLAGKNLPGQQMLAALLRGRLVRKYYRTILKGTLSEEKEAISWLVKDGKTNTVRIFDSQEKASACGRPEKIASMFRPLCAKNGVTLTEVELHTGKSHQIRAQAAHMGFPVIGDVKYGAERVPGLTGHLLHAARLVFSDDADMPEELRGRIIEAPVPDIFKKLIKTYGL